MKIRFECDKCGQHITATEDMIGDVFSCPNPSCGCSFPVPDASTVPSETPDPTDDITFDCPFCSHGLVVDAEGAGLEVTCPKCDKPIIVPQSAPSVAPAQQADVVSAWTPPPPPPPLPRPLKPAHPAAAMPQIPGAPPLPGTPPPPSPAKGADSQSSQFIKLPSIDKFVRAVMGFLASADRLNAAGDGLIIEEKDVRAAIGRVVKGAIAITPLLVLQFAAGFLFHARRSDWLEISISLVVFGIAISLYQPVQTIMIFFVAAWVKTGRMPGRVKYLGNIVAVVGNLTLFVFIVAIYLYLLPVLPAFDSLAATLNVVFIFAAIGTLFLLWKNAQPMIDHLTGHITEKVATVSSGLTYVNCPDCNAKNERDAAFCISCGVIMKKKSPPPPAPAVNNSRCPKCASDNPSAAKFCRQCGNSMAQEGETQA